MSRSPNLRWLLLSLPLLVAGCATVSEAVRQERVYDAAAQYVHARPIEEVWPEAVAFMKEQGYPGQVDPQGFRFVSDWKEVVDGRISSTWRRYYMEGVRYGDGTSRIRIYRHDIFAGRDRPSAQENLRPQGELGRSARLTGEEALDGTGMMNRVSVAERSDPAGGEDPDKASAVAGSTNSALPSSMPTTDDLVSRNFQRARQLEFEFIKRVSPEDARMLQEQYVAAPRSGGPQLASVSSSRAVGTALAASGAGQTEGPGSEASAAAPCGLAVAGTEELLKAGGRVLLGEVPGTAQVPAFVGTLACQAAHAGVPVVVALELPVTEREAVASFLESDGGEAARGALLERAVWQRRDQDGRTSAAVLGLLAQLRALRAQGLPVSAEPYAEPRFALRANAKEEALAAGVLALHEAHPEALLVVLSGNVHARRTPGVPWDPELVPMGARLAARIPGLLVLDAHYTPGTAWLCKAVQKSAVPWCRTFAMTPPARSWGHPPEAPVGRAFVARVPELEAEGFDGVYFVGAVSASPPAIGH